MAASETILYFAFFGLAVIFMAFAIARKTLLLTILTGIMWLTLGAMHLAIAPVDSVMQVAPAVFYFGVGLLFFPLLTIYYAFVGLRDALIQKQRDEESVDIV